MTCLLQLLGFGSSLLDGIDPNPENFVMAGIVHTREAQIGCLLRLEPNKQAQVGRCLVSAHAQRQQCVCAACTFTCSCSEHAGLFFPYCAFVCDALIHLWFDKASRR